MKRKLLVWAQENLNTTNWSSILWEEYHRIPNWNCYRWFLLNCGPINQIWFECIFYLNIIILNFSIFSLKEISYSLNIQNVQTTSSSWNCWEWVLDIGFLILGLLSYACSFQIDSVFWALLDSWSMECNE